LARQFQKDGGTIQRRKVLDLETGEKGPHALATDAGRRGTSKPAQTYGVTSEAELLFLRAYIPILTQLLHVLAKRIPRQELDAIGMKWVEAL
jgi:hypothetical protein